MLKTISAVLLAASVFAAPALARDYGRTTQAPIAKEGHVNSSAFNAYGWMGRDRHEHDRHHHRHHWRFWHHHHHHHH